MARTLDLAPDRARSRPGEEAPAPADGLRRPIRAVLVGGRPEYGNVRKLPDLLWETFGIAVIEHFPVDRTSLDSSQAPFALAIVLNDLVSAQAAANVRDLTGSDGRIVRSDGTWSRLRLAVERAGIQPYSSQHLSEALVAVTRTPPPPRQLPVAAPARETSLEDVALNLVLNHAEQIESLQRQLNTPAVRFALGGEITIERVWQIVIERGLTAAAVELDLDPPSRTR